MGGIWGWGARKVGPWIVLAVGRMGPGVVGRMLSRASSSPSSSGISIGHSAVPGLAGFRSTGGGVNRESDLLVLYRGRNMVYMSPSAGDTVLKLGQSIESLVVVGGVPGVSPWLNYLPIQCCAQDQEVVIPYLGRS